MIRYKKGSITKLVDMLLGPTTLKITTLETLMHMQPFTYDAYKEAYIHDEDFREVYQKV